MRDLPPADATALRATPGVIRILGSGTDPVPLAREIAKVARDVANAANGWVLDPATLLIHSASTFHEYVPGVRPDIRKLIVVHSSLGGNEQPYLDTMGMTRFGLPELYVAESSVGNAGRVMTLIDGAAQVLIEGGDVNERGEIAIDFRKLGWDAEILENGTGKAVWKTRWSAGHDGRRRHARRARAADARGFRGHRGDDLRVLWQRTR